MDPVSSIVSGVIVVLFLLGVFGEDLIKAYWKGKAEVKENERLIAEANARKAEADAKMANQQHSHPVQPLQQPAPHDSL